MILPVHAYGDPVLKQQANDITKDHPGLPELIANMFETMYNASGVGLAAPQVGHSIRLFVVDTAQLGEDKKRKKEPGIKQVFINATMIHQEGTPWSYEEGCLSIPGIRENIMRKPKIEIEYLDQDFMPHRSTFEGMSARVIQHEYDHIEGILFTDHLKPLKKRLLRRRLTEISRGEIKVAYKMRFPEQKR